MFSDCTWKEAIRYSVMHHRSHVGQAAILESGFEEMHYPPYYPDLALSDYHLFPNLKQHLHGQRYSTDDELKYATNE